MSADAPPAGPGRLERSERAGGDPDGSAGGAGGNAPRGIERSERAGGDPDGSAGGAGDNASRGIDRAWAIVFARLVLGLIFFMAGVYKVFELGPLGHARKWFLPFQDTFLPVWSLWAVGTAIPFIELVAGGLLLVGWRIREALLALGAVLVIVTFGHLLHDALYPFHEHVIPRLALLVFVLAMPRGDDRFSLDHLLHRRARA